MATNFLVLSVLLPTLVFGFSVDKGTTLNHQEITKRAILNVIVQACRDTALSKGRTFTAPAEPYNIENVLESCEVPGSKQHFSKTLEMITQYNIKVDKSDLFISPGYHFNNEAFDEGHDIVAMGLSAVKASNKLGNYGASKAILGTITHVAQDFYSKTNWIEMGKDAPNSNLLKGNGDIGKTAGKDLATCISCTGNTCNNNILSGINDGQILTSGYLAPKPSTSKPIGKCSHGGDLDGSSSVSPTGGINKDTPSSSHGQFHEQAANMAVIATSQMLEEVRAAGGDDVFFRMMGAGSGNALCFVVDTTSSMMKELEAIKELISKIANYGARQQPSQYCLVQFKDPSFGPVISTTDPEEFRANIDSLTASGGGDGPEVPLSALQLALTSTPPGSNIFLFTDAAAKDENLKDTIIGLIESKQSVVNILLTGHIESLKVYELYEDLALTSGGRLIRTTKSELESAYDFVLDSYRFSLVTFLDEVRKPGKSENFTFTMDDDSENVIVYVIGSVSDATVVAPSGDDALADSKTAGNFKRMKLIKKVGLWQIQVKSDNPYTVKVVGESEFVLVYHFLEPAQGPLGGMVPSGNRPRADSKVALELTLIGSNTATVTEVCLLKSSGTGQVKGKVTDLGEKQYLVEFDKMPNKEVSLVVKGTNNKHKRTANFQRHLSGTIKPSSLSVNTGGLNGIIQPGVKITVPFSVSSDNDGVYTIKATNDQNFRVTAPGTVKVKDGKADGKVMITASDGVESGTQTTLRIEAMAPGGTDKNFAVVDFIVLNEVTDFSNPSCEFISQTNCSQTCESSRWKIELQVSDEGKDFEVYSRGGNGQMIIGMAPGNAKKVTYEASCCSTEVEFVAVDTVGNTAICPYHTRIHSATPTGVPPDNNTPQTGMSPKLIQSSVLCLILSLFVTHCTN